MKNKTIGDLAKKIKKVGKCKICNKPKYANTSLCYQHYLTNERIKKTARLLKKKTKHETTKVYEKEICDKLIRQNDRLYQELGRATYNRCYFGHEYSALHHFILKSQSLNCRYDVENGIPVCQACHCSIHQGQNSLLVGRIILDKGEAWLNRLTLKKTKPVLNKLEFLKEKNLYLKKALGIN